MCDKVEKLETVHLCTFVPLQHVPESSEQSRCSPGLLGTQVILWELSLTLVSYHVPELSNELELSRCCAGVA